MPTYIVNFDLRSQEFTVDADSAPQAVAKATDELLARFYLVVGRATIDVQDQDSRGATTSRPSPRPQGSAARGLYASGG